MLQVDDDCVRFIVEWYEEIASRIRQFLFSFYVKSKSIEMFDLKNRRMFLKVNLKDEPIELSDLYIGSVINVCGRQLTVKDYADDHTRRMLTNKKEKTLAIIKPDGINQRGEIIAKITEQGFVISQLKMMKLGRPETFDFYRQHQTELFMNDLLSHLLSGPVIAMELVGENVITRWRDFLGVTDPVVARSEAPTSIRARFGTDKIKNACHGSVDAAAAARELELIFPDGGKRSIGQPTAQFTDCTLCIIKPHAVKSGTAGHIMTAILEAGFEISAMMMYNLEKANAEEFLEVYRGVVPEYKSMVAELTCGPLIALEIRAQDAVKRFREMVGPTDPEIARHIRPRTIRALFGIDKVKNAVHCTDLEEDGLLEVEYFFKILST